MVLHVTEGTTSANIVDQARIHTFLIAATKIEGTVIVFNTLWYGWWHWHDGNCKIRILEIFSESLRYYSISTTFTIGTLDVRISGEVRWARAHRMVVVSIA